MKNLILLIIAAALINLVGGVKYEEEDVYDDDFELAKEARTNSEPVEEIKHEPTIYDLKNIDELFDKFIKEFDKEYANAEDYQKHKGFFETNVKKLNVLNKAGGSSSVKINMFSDLSEDEIANLG